MASVRFLCASDLHGELPQETDESVVSAWLVAGDVADQYGRAKRFLAWARKRKAPVFTVLGNHDVGLGTSLRHNGFDLTARARAVVPGLWVLGVGWSGERPEELPNELSMRRCCHRAQHLFQREAQPDDAVILLTHYPPALPGFSFAGEYACVGKLVDDLRPLVVVAGHDHGRFADQLVYGGPRGRSLVVFPGPGGTIDLDLEEWKAKLTPWLPPATPGG